MSPPDDEMDEVSGLLREWNASERPLTPGQGNDVGSFQSSLTSVTSSILHGVVGEGQRVYAAYGKEGTVDSLPPWSADLSIAVAGCKLVC